MTRIQLLSTLATNLNLGMIPKSSDFHCFSWNLCKNTLYCPLLSGNQGKVDNGVRYKIGDVAGILGISPDLIRYYEEKGVVSPAKDPNNNYRYYDTWDIN